ncbi:hypothetical protein SAMN05428988_3082 [Chitinophaga sp. YR573]|uniref:hypothetical protein n=1 Tax=Chitinophaga sp. YR573 TaxID=1881040 RepID=UPI0008CE3472|nr:hypothetical protein [Chitinophaga sp. YR573]SEW20349.1 hypothetical protein SAMN05428988_3082 [Chitinophaga sp. YR573]
MKTVSYLLLLSFFGTVTHAQHKISLTTSDSKAPSGMDISGIQVMNAVSDSSLLGYVQTGMLNRWGEAVADKPLTIFLQSYLDEQYKSIYKKDAPQLLWVIQELHINERTFSMSEKGFVRLKAKAFAGNETFKWITQIDTVLVMSGLDVTHKHGDHIAEALQLLLQASLASKQSDSPAYSLSEIKEKAAQRYLKPALQAKEHEDGIYMTFEAFINDTPSFTNVAYDSDTDHFYYKDSTGKRIYVDKFWGLRREGMAFKQYEGKLIPIEQKQNAIVLTDYLPKARRKNNVLLGSMIGGGLIGGAIAGAASGGMLPTVDLPYIKKKAPLATGVDIETGELTL